MHGNSKLFQFSAREPYPGKVGIRPYLAVFLLGLSLLLPEPLLGAAELLQNSRAALEDELYDVAGAKLKRYLQEASAPAERGEGMLLLVQALHGQKRYQELLEVLEQNRKLASGSPQADAFEFWRAFAHFERGEWQQTVEECRRLDQQYPQSP
ncbi:MAG: hypothetical protein HYV36_07660, partial [Lentisphaerae bacterium]|nr:hypothetical protein [Lentisphaerota bacterium]